MTEAWFKARYAESGKRLNMGKSCLRFRRVEDVPLDVIAETIGRVDLDAFVATTRPPRARRASRARWRLPATPDPAFRRRLRTSTDATLARGWLVCDS